MTNKSVDTGLFSASVRINAVGVDEDEERMLRETSSDMMNVNTAENRANLDAAELDLPTTYNPIRMT